VKREGVRGRVRTRPDEVIPDSAYDTKKIRRYLNRRGIRANIPRNIKRKKKARRGRPTRFNRDNYSVGRSCVERFLGWLKGGFRRLIIRYERLTYTFLGLLHLACIAIPLRGHQMGFYLRLRKKLTAVTSRIIPLIFGIRPSYFFTFSSIFE